MSQAEGVVHAGGVPAKRRREVPRLVISSMRPKQWLKNAFVLTGLLFSGRALELDADLRALGAFVAFCAVSGAMYLVNDVADASTDRINPRTALRPLARGALSRTSALAAAAFFGAVGLAVGALIGWQTLLVLAGFVALQITYTQSLKHMLIVDVLAIAGGFVLRALAGIVAIDSVLSPWLLLEAGLLALFLALSKRRGEVIAFAGAEATQRRVLAEYTVPMLDELIRVVTPMILIVYAIYCVLGARSPVMLVTLPFVLYGMFRVIVLMHQRPTMTEDPTAIAWHDRPLMTCMLIWGICAGAITVLTT